MSTAVRALFLVLAVAVGAGFYLLSYTEAPVEAGWALPAATNTPAGALTVRFSGTSTLLFSDGETRWMTDGWFSRPGLLQIARGAIAPDQDAIAYGLKRNGVTNLAAVIPLHSHYDHAMDAPLVAQRTGARVIGSEATANIARGLGLDENRITVVSDRQTIRLGAFRITFIESRHFQYPNADMVETLLTDSEITEPLVPPVPLTEYKLGKAYVLYVVHPAMRFMVIGSAGFVPGILADYQADVLFLGIGGIGSQTPQYREDFWHHTVEAVKPDQIILLHWDSLLAPLEGLLVGEMRAATLLAGDRDDTLTFLKAREAAKPEQVFATLPRFDPVMLKVPDTLSTRTP